MTEFVIRIALSDPPEYLESYDPNWQPSPEERLRLGAPKHQTGLAIWTLELDEAMWFDSWEDAFECWRQQSTVVPTRPDGKPNRPLTAFTTEIVPIDHHIERES